MQDKFKNLIFLLFFLVPIFFVPGNVFIEADKAIVFRLITSIVLVGWWLHLHKTKHMLVPKLDPIIVVAIAGVVFSSSLSVLLSVSPHVSFWGSMQRPMSFLTLVFCALLVVMIVTSFSKKDFGTAFKVVVWSSVLVSGYALLQFVGLDIFGLSSDLFSGRAVSFLAHPSFLGQYLLLTIFLTLEAGKRALFQKNTLFVLIPLQVLALLASGNRASIVGLLAGGFLYLLLHKKYRLKALVLSGLLVAFISALQFLPLQDVPGLDRLYLTNRNLDSVQTRNEIWKNSTKIIKQRLLLGHGPEVFSFTFAPYVNSNLIGNESLNSRPDRAHNFIVQVLHDYGLLGFLFLSLLTIWLLKYCYQYKEETFFAMLVGYMVSMLFGFQSLPDALIILLIVAYLLSKNRVEIPIKPNLLTSSFVAVFVAVSLWISGSQFLGNYYFSVNKLDSAAKYGFMFHDLRQYDAFYNNDPEILTKVINQNPLNNEAWYIKGSLAFNNKDYSLAEQYADNSLKLFPNDIKSIELYAKTKFEIGSFANSIDTYQRLLNLLPNYWSKDSDDKDYLFKKRIFLKENPDFLTNFIYISRAYFELGDKETAFRYLEYSEDGYDKFYTYAVMYERLGELDLSEEFLEKAYMFTD